MSGPVFLCESKPGRITLLKSRSQKIPNFYQVSQLGTIVPNHLDTRQLFFRISLTPPHIFQQIKCFPLDKARGEYNDSPINY